MDLGGKRRIAEGGRLPDLVGHLVASIRSHAAGGGCGWGGGGWGYAGSFLKPWLGGSRSELGLSKFVFLNWEPLGAGFLRSWT